jgi:ParB family chromosome partitioning protein
LAAREVAAETFGRDAALPFERSEASDQGPLEGRRRLSGAFLIDIDRIETDPNQPRKRIDEGYLDELTQSIHRHGVLQPISVRYVEETNHYRIVAGECRYTASKRAGIDSLPCWVKSPKENEILVHQIVENWVRCDLNAFELADSLAILRDANHWTQQQLAQQTGKSKGEISKLLSILSLDPSVQSVARQDETGRISKRHLYALSRVPVPHQNTLLKRIQRDDLTAIDVERLIEREARRRETGDARGARTFRRSFRTSRAHVTFSFRMDTIGDEHGLEAIHEIKRQLARDER